MNQLLHLGFEESAKKTPSAPALTIKTKTFSYKELEEEANSIAANLQLNKISKGSRVGVLQGKSFEAYASILAILKVGGVFIPIEPSYPKERKQHIVNIADLSSIIYSNPSSLNELILDERIITINTTNLKPNSFVPAKGSECSPDDLAYILFTSGSTGLPKGVMISHKNATSFINWATEYFEYSPSDRVAGHSDLMFDLSIMDTFCSWQAGSHLFPVLNDEKMLLGSFIQKNNISIWFSVPSVLPLMIKLNQITPQFLSSLKSMLFCGEPLKPQFIRPVMIQNPKVRVANLYGPTEATIACSVHEISSPPENEVKSLSIGYRTGATMIKVLDSNMKEVKVRETGEIFIVGEQVGVGYWKNEEETQKKFITDPTSLTKKNPCFRTGDLAIILDDGPHFIGRGDTQVKVNGWRIELEDIESALLSDDNIVEAAVTVLTKDDGGDELIAFIHHQSGITSDGMIKALKQKLPDYMIPKRYVFTDQFPRTLNGKLDRKSLKMLL